MRYGYLFFGLAIVALAACDKHDPILPGVRSNVFDTPKLNVLGENVPNLVENIDEPDYEICPYNIDFKNTLWMGERKIYSGFATGNSVAGKKTPTCRGNFVYAGLTTGELIKVNGKTRAVAWVADIYRPSNMTGGATVVDIVAPIVFDNNYIMVGGLGDAFCRISDKTGNAVWCINIGVAHPFVVTNGVAFVVDTDKNLNAVRPRL